ncbi:hypothetical protein AGMMS49579_16650 [Spirochaetia bacterium]|nr:hypothetical protein AGMMS49579_16650 [Spirochaetia bacterium]
MNRKSICFAFLFFCCFIGVAFCGPFGIDFGMSLERVRQISKTSPENIEDDFYIITPPNTNEMFEAYLVKINPTYGVYFIKAIGKDISTNAQGTILKNQFNNLVSSVEKTYGKYKKDDSSVPGSYWGDKPDYYMYALSRDERTLYAYWNAEEGSKLPPELSLIIVAANGKNASTGYLIIEYYSKNYEKIEAEQESVF